jgi:hypothetical protein
MATKKEQAALVAGEGMAIEGGVLGSKGERPKFSKEMGRRGRYWRSFWYCYWGVAVWCKPKKERLILR